MIDPINPRMTLEQWAKREDLRKELKQLITPLKKNIDRLEKILWFSIRDRLGLLEERHLVLRTNFEIVVVECEDECGPLGGLLAMFKEMMDQ